MTIQNTPDKEDEDEKKPTPFKLLTGGKDTQDPNWLKSMEVGSVFLTRPKNDGYGKINLGEGLAILELVAKTERSARLYDSINHNSFMVDMQRFSGRMELFEMLGQVKNEDNHG